MIIAAVPMKDLNVAKQRLASALTLADRDQLARAMLRDVLRALGGAGFDRVWVVTREPAVEAIARALGAEPLAEVENRGHTAAVALAQAEAIRRGARVFLTVPGDVPRVTPDELRRLDRAALAGLTPRERLALALRLGARDLEAFRLAQTLPLTPTDADRILRRRRQQARRPSRCLQELIG